MKSRLLVGFCIIFVILAVFSCGSAEEEKIKFFNKGEALYEKGEYGRAILEFKNAVQVDPKFAEAYHKLGECEMRLNNFRRAFGYFTKAVGLDARLWEAQLALAGMLVRGGQVDKAKEKVDEVLAEHPENFRALLLNSAILFRKDKAEEAERILKDLIAKDPENVEAPISLARLMERQLRINEAEEVLKESLKKDEKNRSLLLVLADLYTKAENLSKAELVHKRLVEYYPQEKGYLITLARFYVRTDQGEKGEEIYRSLVKDEPDMTEYRIILAKYYDEHKSTDKSIEVLKNAVHDLPEELRLQLFLGEMYLKTNDLDLSLKTFNTLAEIHPLKPEACTARNRIARIYLLQRKTDLAMSQLDMVLKENPKDVEAHSLRGIIFLAEGKGLEAVGEFRVVIEENPDDPKGYDYLARAHMLNNEKTLAIDNLKRAVNIDPGYKEALDSLLQLYSIDKSYDDAIALLDEVLVEAPENLFAISRLGDFYLVKGDVKRAEMTFRQLQDKAPKNSEGFVMMSIVYGKKKDYPSAEKELDRALALEPENMNIIERVVWLQMFLKRADRALKKCRDQIKKAPSAEPGIRMLMSKIYSSRKKYAEAEEQIKKAMNLKPESVAPYAALGNLYFEQGNINQGIEEFMLALKQRPDDARLKFMIAILYRKKNDYDTAINWYERIVDEHPKFIPALNNLAYVYADKYPTRENLDRALNLLTQIPQELLGINTLDTLGWVHYHRKEYDRAIELFKDAESRGDVPAVQLHLGLAYLEINQMIQARAALEKALKDEGRCLSEKDKKLAKQALRRLQESMS